MISYLKLFIYACVFSIGVCLVLGAGVASLIYFSKGYWFFPLHQIKRALVFGTIAGTAITVAAVVFKLIDVFNARKKTPSDPKE
ncbi:MULTISPECIES: hypothetical protein [unclassified Enterobacter]|uniref:hypothetical protein n=1 Tax=unclassified Enterobacter TaxID=2608935 RepID=UPI0010CA3527|nr:MULTISPECIES: hypothetical protein [unclassified Enterobacter]UAN24676.1 hypothetical protein KGP25_25240 [Enterobacter sp. JBIWA003]UAN34209.1 hypothetical protein KGP22_22655 [Enterobacter sp. JBIWA005]BBJ69872.1 hypothetical protein ECC18A13_p11140 [Enterobacter sp. 18A13]